MSQPQVSTRFIKDSAVTEAKIADTAVTNAKLAADAVTQAKIANDAVGTAEIIDDNVTLAKIAAAARASAATASVLVERDSNGRAQFADPSAAADAATKNYVDLVAAGARDFKDSVRLATAAAPAAYSRTGNVITFSANGSQSVDGVETALNDRILLKDGAAGADNGLYYVSTKGTAGTAEVWTRTTDADSSAEVTPGMYFVSEEGTTNADKAWVLATNAPITLNTTSLSFTLVATLADLTAGTDLTKTGNTIDHDDSGVVAGTYDMAKVVVNARGHVTSVTARQFAKYSGTAAGGETTINTGTNVLSKSARVVIDGVSLSEEHGDFSIVLATGVITLTTALVAGEKWEAQVVRDA